MAHRGLGQPWPSRFPFRRPDTVVAPGSSAGIFKGRLVIVSGPSGAVVGVFVYQAGTTPALGNPPIFWATSSSHDPSGNAIPSTAGVAGTGTFEAGTTLVTPSGILTYSALPPALGGLVSSLSVSAQFTDSAGNVVLAGNTSYVNIGGSNFIATSEQGGALLFFLSTTGANGTFNLISTMTISADGDIHYSATASAHMVADTLWFGKDPVSGVRGLWNDMRPLSNSFVGSVAGQYPPQYRYTPDGYVEVAGYVQFPAAGGPNFNSVTFATLPAAFRPAANAGHRWPITLTTNVAPVGVASVQIDTSGNLQFHNCPAAGMASNIAGIYGSYPLNAPIAS